MRRNLGGILALASLCVPAAMLAVAYVIDRSITSCFDDWSGLQQALYNDLLVASPFVAATLAFSAVAATGIRWRYLLASVASLCSLAVFGIAAVVIAYNGGGCAG